MAKEFYKTNAKVSIFESVWGQFRSSDFIDFDHILVMDNSNYNNVISMAQNQHDKNKVETLLSYGTAEIKEVPDPYYEGGFDYVFDLIENAIDDFISKH